MSDNELILGLREGDHAAFEEIYKRYWALLFRHALRMVRDEETAKDIIQDVFSTLYVKSGELQLRTSLKSYLYAAVRNKFLDMIAHERVKSSYQESLKEYLEAGEWVTDKVIREKELEKCFERELELLPAKMREVFELSRKADLSYKEIANQLDVSEHTVRKQISNALKILKVKFSTSLQFLIFFNFFLH